MISNMPPEFEDYPAELAEFSYDNLCTGFCDKIDLSSYGYEFYEDEDEMHGDGGIPSAAHFLEYEGTGDSAIVSPETEEPQELFEQNEELVANNFQNGIHEENSHVKENHSSPSISDDPRQELRIRYTRKYLLNCSRSPLSSTFPDCLLKYLYSDVVPLKREKEVHRDHRSIDHILFYTALPYTRTKYFLGRSLKNTT